jgi:hypothetical protein
MDLKKSYRKAVFLWMVMVFSTFVYAWVVEFMKRDPVFLQFPSPFPEAATFRYVFLFLAIAEFFLIGFLRKQALARKPARSHSTEGPLPEISSLVSASVVTDTLCELLAIYGLVLFFLTKDPFDFYIFLAWSLVYFALYFPRYEQWEENFRGKDGEENLGIFVRS